MQESSPGSLLPSGMVVGGGSVGCGTVPDGNSPVVGPEGGLMVVGPCSAEARVLT